MVFLPGVGEEGAVMIAGGLGNGGSLDSVEVYVIQRNVWEVGTQMLTARYGHGMGFLPGVGEEGAVMVAGGYNGGYLDSVEVYDIQRNVWEVGTQMLTARYGPGMVFLPGVGEEGAVMVAGGWNGGFLDSVEFSVPATTSTTTLTTTTTILTTATTTIIYDSESGGIDDSFIDESINITSEESKTSVAETVGWIIGGLLFVGLVVAAVIFYNNRKQPSPAPALNNIPMLPTMPGRPTTATYTPNTTTAAPPYWSNLAQRSCASANPQYISFAETKAMLSPCTRVLKETFLQVATRDRHGNPLPTKLKVVDVMRNENAPLWSKFAVKRAAIRQELQTVTGQTAKGVPGPGNPVPKTMQNMDPKYLGSLAADVNEFYLFHGTSPSSVDGIFNTGFQVSLAGSAAGTAFGNGAYFAECSSKSDEYAKDASGVTAKGKFALLLCRVVCGNMRYVTSFDTAAHTTTKPPQYHSLLGDREAAVNTYREFIVYDGDQIYPEFAIIYKRDF
jgi:hypothetical protein